MIPSKFKVEAIDLIRKNIYSYYKFYGEQMFLKPK